MKKYRRITVSYKYSYSIGNKEKGMSGKATVAGVNIVEFDKDIPVTDYDAISKTWQMIEIAIKSANNISSIDSIEVYISERDDWSE